MTPEVAARSGWGLGPATWLVHDPAGPIDSAAEQRLAGALSDQWDVRVERGYDESIARYVRWGLTGLFGLLLLVITLTSTGLAMIEQRSQQATLSAVGATPGARRMFAAAQASAVGLIGGGLGLCAGLLPGEALGYAVTRQHPGGATLDIPWASLLMPVWFSRRSRPCSRP